MGDGSAVVPGPVFCRHYTVPVRARQLAGVATGILPIMLLLLAALLVAVDQWTKAWAASAFRAGGSMPVGLGFNFTYVENTGAAFGILRNVSFNVFGLNIDGVVLLGILSLVVSILLAWFIIRHSGTVSRLTRIALALLLAGAAGNMIDRLLHRYVIDFIHFQWGNFNFPVFNVADICVVIGASLLLLSGFTDRTDAAARAGQRASGSEAGRAGQR